MDRETPQTRVSKMPIGVCAAKRGLPPIPAFGIGWLSPVCPRPTPRRTVLRGIARQNGAYYPWNMRTISVKLPDELLAQLAREAKARRVTKSSLLRESLAKGLHEESSTGAGSCYDLARDLADSVKGLPKDLASNPKYMEGFGR